MSVVDELGYDVVGEASDGNKGVRQVSEHRPDVVVMDFHMPVMDGLEATRQIKARYPEINVIAYTSTDDPAIQQEFFDAGACDHVEKGDLERLIAALSRCGAAGRSGAGPT